LALSPALLLSDQAFAEMIVGRTFSGDGKAEALRAASGLTVKNSMFTNYSSAAVRVNQAANLVMIDQCRGSNLYRFLENTASDSSVLASLTNFVLRQTTATGLERGMTRIRYGSYGGLIEDVVAVASDSPADYCVGFALDDTAHDIIYRRASASGFAVSNLPGNSYWNGDGFSDERGNYDIQYLGCTATGSTDGGFDLKSTDVIMAGCLASGNKRNYRLWGNGLLTSCRSENPQQRGGTGRPAHFSFSGGTAKYIIDRPIVRASPGNTAPVFLFNNDAPALVEIRNADIQAADAPLIVNEKVMPVVKFVPPLAEQNIRAMF
jgi:hypothetical protein